LKLEVPPRSKKEEEEKDHTGRAKGRGKWYSTLASHILNLRQYPAAERIAGGIIGS